MAKRREVADADIVAARRIYSCYGDISIVHMPDLTRIDLISERYDKIQGTLVKNLGHGRLFEISKRLYDRAPKIHLMYTYIEKTILGKMRKIKRLTKERNNIYSILERENSNDVRVCGLLEHTEDLDDQIEDLRERVCIKLEDPTICGRLHDKWNQQFAYS